MIAYEVTNAIWKHEHLLKDLKHGKPYLSVFFGLIKAGRITTLSLMQEAYVIAERNKITVYDTIFICLAIKLGLILMTYDEVQIQVLKNENNRRSGQH